MLSPSWRKHLALNIRFGDEEEEEEAEEVLRPGEKKQAPPPAQPAAPPAQAREAWFYSEASYSASEDQEVSFVEAFQPLDFGAPERLALTEPPLRAFVAAAPAPAPVRAWKAPKKFDSYSQEHFLGVAKAFQKLSQIARDYPRAGSKSDWKKVLEHFAFFTHEIAPRLQAAPDFGDDMLAKIHSWNARLRGGVREARLRPHPDQAAQRKRAKKFWCRVWANLYLLP